MPLRAVGIFGKLIVHAFHYQPQDFVVMRKQLVADVDMYRDILYFPVAIVHVLFLFRVCPLPVMAKP